MTKKPPSTSLNFEKKVVVAGASGDVTGAPWESDSESEKNFEPRAQHCHSHLSTSRYSPALHCSLSYGSVHCSVSRTLPSTKQAPTHSGKNPATDVDLGIASRACSSGVGGPFSDRLEGNVSGLIYFPMDRRKSGLR